MSMVVNPARFGGAAYVKPALVRISSGAAVGVDETTGWLLAAENAASYRLDRPITAGKWYFEIEFLAAYVLGGVTNQPTTHYDYGGWNSSVNSLFYSSSWSTKNWGANEETLYPSPTANDEIGIGIDAENDVVNYRVNDNGFSASHFIGGQAGPYYALIAAQSSPSIRIRLGPTGCVWPLPAGYDYL